MSITRRIARRAGSIASGLVLGRVSSGTGSVELLNPTDLVRSSLVTPRYTGTVTSVATGTGMTGGPITRTGTISLSTPVSVANGGTSQSSFTNGQILIGNTSGNTLTKASLTAGSGVTITPGGGSITISATGTGGTVTSVGLSLPAELTVSGSPVTTTGTLTAVWATESANNIFAGPTTGSAATPAFRSLVGADLPNPASSSLGGVQSKASVTSNFLTQISTSGVVSQAQPAFSDISGTLLTASQLDHNSVTINSHSLALNGSLTLAFSDFAGTVSAAQLPNPSASTLGGIESYVAVSHQWINTISTSGVPSSTQPAFTDISGSVAASQLPNPGASTLGGIESYASVSHQWINTISTSGVPSSSQPAFTDISGSVSATQLPNPSATTLGGIESIAAVSHQWINTISTSGVPNLTQPAFSDISGTAAVNQGGTGQTTYTDGQILIGNSTGNTLAKATLSAGSGITITNGSGTISIAATGSGGTVTSVALTAPSEISVAGSPITGSGTLALTWATETTNKVFAAPNGSTGTPSFRALVGADLPNPGASSLGGVQSKASVASNFLTQISTSGVVSQAQPAFTDISGSVAASQLPNPSASTLGGIESIAAVSHQWINTISTSGVPALSQPAFTDISGSVAASQLPNPSASTLGGIESYAAVSSQWIRQISTSGVPSSSQPAFTDISGTNTIAQLPGPAIMATYALCSGI